LSWVPSSIGEPHTTISGSPISTSHQRVARHLAATSWVTRSVPMKKISGSPLEPPVLKRASPWASSARSVAVLLDHRLGEEGQRLQVGRPVTFCGSKPVRANRSR
jgi:hypothetical protein